MPCALQPALQRQALAPASEGRKAASALRRKIYGSAFILCIRDQAYKALRSLQIQRSDIRHHCTFAQRFPGNVIGHLIT